MSGGTALVVGFVVLALVWAYSRHAFDSWLGLATPHGYVQGGPMTPITHTGNGYGKVQTSVVSETGPMTGPSGPVGGTRITRDAYGGDASEIAAAMVPAGPLVTGRRGRAPSGLISPDETVIRATGDPSQSFASPELGLGGYRATSGRWVN